MTSSTPPAAPPATPAAGVFLSDSVMARLCRGHDWAATPLGPVETWPQSLRTAAGLVMSSAFATIVCWGPELVQIYNDGYIEISGAKHPWALGRPTYEVWPEVWHLNGPLFARAQAGETVYVVEAPYPLERRGPGRPADDTYFTLSFSPIPDERGRVGGVVVTAIEVTEQVHARRAAEAFLIESEAANAQLQEQGVELELSNQQLQENAVELEAQQEVLRATAARLEEQVDAADRAAAALAASDARYRTLLASLDTGFCVIELLFDERGEAVDYRYLETNQAFWRQSGLPPDMVGRRIREVAPDLEAHWFAAFGRVATTGEPARLKDYAAALGRWFDVFAYRVDDPALRRVAVLFTDVTEATAAQDALDLERRRLAALIDQLPVGVHVAEAPSGRLVIGNAAVRRIWGAAPLSEAVDEYSANYLAYHRTGPRAGEPIANHEWPLARTLATGEVVTGEVVEVARPDGSRGRVSLSSAPVRDADGRLVGGVVTSTDVTERERLLAATEEARGAAEAANQAKSQFLANMSHELRTPLNAIQGYVELLDMGLHGPVTDDQRAALARVQRAQARLLALINDVLNYAKLEGGHVEYDLRPVDVRDVVADVMPLVEPQLRAKGVALAVRLPDEPCVARADRQKLGQVLVNLLSNAAKFTDAGGRVEVRGAADGDAVRVRVADTGRGIPRQQHDAIFQPFVQLRAGYAQATEGTGLGLAISRDLMRGMGGDLTVESEVGVGSTFTLTLRRADEG
jgi:signal transduction histidine kinase